MVTEAPRPIVVIGAGIAGLAAAYELARHGEPCVVLERAERPGGVILTEHLGGFVIDGGPDSLLVQKPAAITLCRELGLGDRLVPTNLPRTAFIFRAGRLHPLPEASVLGIPTRITPLATTGLFSWSGKLRMAFEALVPARAADSDESIGAFMRRRFGQEAVDYLAEPLMAGIHAGDVDQLSLPSAFPRFRHLERTRGSLIRAFRSLPHRRSPDGVFRAPVGGIGVLVDAIVRALPPGTLQCRAPVAAIVGPRASAQPPEPIRVITEAGDAIEARAVVLAVPAYAAADLFAPLDADLGALCRAVPYASTCTVALGYPRQAVRHPLNGSGFIVPRVERGIRIMAASWMSSKWPGRAPDGQVLLRAFVGGLRNPELFQLADAEVAALAQDDLARLLGIAGQPSLVRVYRWPRANAQHIVGHLARMAQIDARLLRLPGVFVTGSGFRGTGIPDCVEDGRIVAQRAMEFARTAPGPDR